MANTFPSTAANTNVINGGVAAFSGSNGYNGIAAINTTTKMRVSFQTNVTNPSGYVTFMYTAL